MDEKGAERGAAPARLLWDHGGLWSLMSWEACRQAGLEISPITAAEVAAGGLAGAQLILVPGGWPSLKRRALGRAGARAIRRFVEQGGLYLGLCGGAGLALRVKEGLGLVELQRVASGRRLAGASGPIQVELNDPDHPLWQGLGPRPCFHVWWPAQLARPRDEQPVQVLATYGPPAPGFCTSDLRADQVAAHKWPALEESYGINLDPARLQGWPAVVEASRGQGRVILSHLHFDTPGDPVGLRVLANLWRAYLGREPSPRPEPFPASEPAGGPAARAAELWEHGRRLGLWEPRSPVMPLWKRASRGLEFWSLLRLCRALEPRWPELPASRRRQLGRILEDVWRQGPLALQGLAAALAGKAASPQAEKARETWFGVPRRVGGELGRALELLEEVLLEAIRLPG